MSDQRSNDGLWGWVFGASEERLGQFASEVLRNPSVSETLAVAFRRAAETKGQVDRNVAALLSSLGVPSRSDHEQLVAKVEALQGSLVNISMKLDRLLAEKEARNRPAPRRTPEVRADLAGPLGSGTPTSSLPPVRPPRSEDR